ncbi:hypothetical protein [Paraburkholderia sp. J41]|uniref:hypothetical protein n=1 Tax=Paraburkholderia sp. J41 TaxID=2805433 RepID=UPI002AC3549E|nr:hypothetical protein [Paraburkholderia sp. J41]
MKPTNVMCPAWPDAQELRMLRALVQEGIEASRKGPYAARFHGWLIRIFRRASPLGHSVYVKISSRGGAAWACVATAAAVFIEAAEDAMIDVGRHAKKKSSGFHIKNRVMLKTRRSWIRQTGR